MNPLTIRVGGFSFVESTAHPTADLEGRYSVDFYLEVRPGYLIGLQAKSRSHGAAIATPHHRGIGRRNNRRFTDDFHGPVFEYDRDSDNSIILWNRAGSRFRGSEVTAVIQQAVDDLS